MTGQNKDRPVGLPARVAMATMHGKEQALAPALAAIGVELVMPKALDTDQFGTFTRDRPRRGSMLDAARAKAEAAMRNTGLSAALASEGSYGPHPMVPFLAAGRELLLFVDRARGLEITEMTIDERPTFDHCAVGSLEEAHPFLERIGFPDQGVIVAPGGRLNEPVAKGLRDLPGLRTAIAMASKQSDEAQVHIETDMRAFMNPRRMDIIAALGHQLAARLSTACAACGEAGWGKIRTEAGLPCSLCGAPTSLPRHDVYGCVACGAEERQERSPGNTADPAYCPLCNP